MQHSDIKGFTDQSEKNKSYVNTSKETEERLVRFAETLMGEGYDTTLINGALDQFMIGFMLLNRSIFQPQRIELPEDKVNMVPEGDVPKVLPRPAIYVGDVYHNDEKHRKEDAFGDELIAIGPHWYVKSEWDAYEAAQKAAAKS